VRFQFALRQCRLAAAAAAAVHCVLQGQTAIRNVYNWRVKETERMVAIVTELGKLGAQVGTCCYLLF
jgi:5-enolpyruvylshikimate-3-phosphate synthase